MRIRRVLVSFAIASAICTGSAFAQAPNPKAEKQWQQFLTKHPKVQAGLVNDSKYLAKHPGMAQWLGEHPSVSAYARQQGQIGGWDARNQWHDRNWWVHNDPTWVRENHEEWLEHEAREHDADEGEWDNRHQWHDRGWWVHNNPAWVHEHHEDWLEHEAREHDADEGEWDEHHHWHDRGWWKKNHGDWAHHQHPGWDESEEHHDHHHDHGGHHDKD